MLFREPGTFCSCCNLYLFNRLGEALAAAQFDSISIWAAVTVRNAHSHTCGILAAGRAVDAGWNYLLDG